MHGVGWVGEVGKRWGMGKCDQNTLYKYYCQEIFNCYTSQNIDINNDL